MLSDINGDTVKVGSKVRVLQIDPKITEHLSEEEVSDINSMLNDVLEVYEVDEHGHAWVEKWWKRGEDQSECHCLALSSSEMELVPDACS